MENKIIDLLKESLVVFRRELEKQKLYFSEEGQPCYGENLPLKTAEEYEKMLTNFANTTSSIMNFENTLLIQERNAEQMKKMEGEAKGAK